MRPIVAALLLLAYSLPAAAGEVEVLASTPAGVELTNWCRAIDDGACRQAVADVAQSRCQAVGRNAQYVRAQLIERSVFKGEKAIFI